MNYRAYRPFRSFFKRTFILLILALVFTSSWYMFSRPSAVLGLDGYCPVTLLQKSKWERGDPKFHSTFAGCLFLFVGADELRVFESAPERYAPVLSGYDVVHFLDEKRDVIGMRKYGVEYHDRIFLFDSIESRERFAAKPKYYSTIK
jgi:hypothetical protein